MIIHRNTYRHVKGSPPTLDPIELQDRMLDRDLEDGFTSELRADPKGMMRELGLSASFSDEGEG